MKTPLLQRVLFFDDLEPRSAAANMAIDESLLSVREAVLRVYSWKNPTVSIGYFSPWSSVEHPEFNGWEKVRRWTGGGLVRHDGQEITYALSIPETRMRGMEVYRAVHTQIAQILAAAGLPAFLAPKPESGCTGLACFSNPVEADLISAEGNKVAGAAQRRGRQGLLQQGSVRNTSRPEFGAKLAALLAEQVLCMDASALILDSVPLVAKYGSQLWSQKH